MITLSIVIPAYDEERKIAADVEAAAAFLASEGIDGEVIVADDGSRDATRVRAEQASVPPAVGRSVVSTGIHRGKGAAVRTGILASRGQYVLFADSGLTVPYRYAREGLRLLQEGEADLAHGSRELPESTIRRARDWDRKIISRLFHSLAFRWMGLPRSLTDTQCGFKLYRGEIARELYAASTLDGFMFDIEIILLALQRSLRIAEFPVEWTCDRDSRLTVRGSATEILRDLLHLRKSLG